MRLQMYKSKSIIRIPHLYIRVFTSIIILIFWGYILPAAAVCNNLPLYYGILLAGIIILALTNKLNSTAWLSSIIIFSVFEPPTLMTTYPVEIAGLTILPYKVVTALGVAICSASLLINSTHKRRPKLPVPVIISITLLSIAGFLSSFTSLLPLTAFCKTLTMSFCLFLALGLAYLSQSANQASLGLAIRISLYVLAALAAYQLLNFYDVIPEKYLWFRYEEGMWLRFGCIGPQRAYATFHNPNYLALWITLALLLLRHLQLAKLFDHILVIMLSFLSLSVSGFVTTVTALLIGRARRIFRSSIFYVLMLIPFILLLMLPIIPLPPNINSVTGRLYIGYATAEAFSQSPLIGVGLGVLERTFALYGPSNYSSAATVSHNIIWEILVGVGIIGTLGFLLLLFSAGRKLAAYPNLHAAIIAVFIWGQWQPGITWLPLWILFGIALGLGMGSGLNEKIPVQQQAKK